MFYFLVIIIQKIKRFRRLTIIQEITKFLLRYTHLFEKKKMFSFFLLSMIHELNSDQYNFFNHKKKMIEIVFCVDHKKN